MSTITTKLTNILETKENIKSAIQNKGVPISDTLPFGAYSNAIAGIKTSDDIVLRFYDYNGDLLYVYTKNEVENMSSLPECPSHNGLLCKGWNYDLNTIKEEIASGNVVNTGAIYVTDDNTTRYYIHLSDIDDLTMYIEYNTPATATTVRIDWGDGNIQESQRSQYQNIKASHTYETAGDYVISIWSDEKINIGAYYTNSNSIPGISSLMILRKVEIGNNIGTIRDYCFYNCRNLKTITISDSVTTIGSCAFIGCVSLESAIIPNSITTLSVSVFQACYALSSVSIPSSVTSIKDSAFRYCRALSSVSIPSSVTSIEQYAFSFCNALQYIFIPNSITTINNYVFQQCYALTSIAIPDSVTSIGQYAFYQCTALTSAILSNSLTSLGQYAFYECSSLNNINIPNSLTTIESYAFSKCASLNNVIIPNSITSIKGYAFESCSNFTSIVIPDSVNSISSYAFNACTHLKYVSLPDLRTLNSELFSNCSELTDIDMTRMSYPPNTILSNGSSALGSSRSTTYKVLVNNLLYDDWITSKQWKNIASKIQSGFTVSRVKSTSFSAENVRGNYDYTDVVVTYVIDGTDHFGNVVTDKVCTHYDKVYIGQNKTNDSVEKTVKYTYMGIENTTTIIQSAYVDNCIICKYIVTNSNVNSSISLTNSSSSNVTYVNNYFDSMIVDGNDPIAFSRSYTFDTVGTHEVVFKVKDGASITTAYYMFYGCSSLTYADLSEFDMSAIVGNTNTGSTGYYAYTFYGCTNLNTLILPASNNYMGYRFLENCTSLRTLIHKNPIAPNTTANNYVFGGYNSNSYTGYQYRYCQNNLWVPYEATGYTSGKWSSNLCSSSYGGFTLTKEIIPETCDTFEVTVDDVYGQETNTKITFNATVSGIDRVAGEVEGVSVTKTYYSEEFEQNTSRTDSITRSVVVNYGDKSETVEFTQGPWADCIICRYNITSTGSANILCSSTTFSDTTVSNYFSHMLIDGKRYTPAKTFSFTKTGLQEVMFIIKPEAVITTTYYMFYNCPALKYADLTYVDMSNITSTGNGSTNSSAYMFYSCTGINTIILPESIKVLSNNFFDYCYNLKELTIKSMTAPATGNNVFNSGYYTSYSAGYNNRNSNTNRLYVPYGSTGYDSGAYKSYLYNKSYCGFTKEYLFDTYGCTSLTATPQETIIGNDNSFQMNYTAIVHGFDNVLGRETFVTVTGKETIEIEYNVSTTENKIYTIPFTYLDKTIDVEVVQSPWLLPSYTVDLNGQWRESTIVSNPDPELYDAVYESNSNYNVHSKAAIMYINISRYDEFTIYIASSSEGGCDKVYASSIDADNDYYTGTTYGSSYTANSSNPVHTPSRYSKITYSNLNKGDHKIRIRYYKDSSANVGYDRGFLIIPKQ